MQGAKSPNINLPEIQRLFNRSEAKRIQQERQQGLGKPIISAELNGMRFIAIQNKLHYSKNWKTFDEFLADYLKLVFEKEWWFSWIDKPREHLHPILLWAQLMHEQQSREIMVPGEIHTMAATGAMSAYLTLAYDLYSIAHNNELQSKLVARLKNIDQFWGARYEIFAAASLIRAGFDVEFEDEDDRSSTHCEFTATSRKSGRKFSVEAKHRAGTNFRFGRQLNRALKKAAQFERLVFIDVNMPGNDVDDETAHKSPLLKAVKDLRPFENRLINGAVLPSAYLVISNSPQHHHLNSTSFHGGVLMEGFRISDFEHDASYKSVRDAIESKERHREMHDLITSIRDHSQIPSTFDGEIPEFAFGETSVRLQIGDAYNVSFNGTSRVGRLTSATVNEAERLVYCAYHFEDTDEAAILDVQMSNTELTAWRRHPDTYFGIPGSRSTEAKNPIELYEFFLRSHGALEKSKLLELMANSTDIEVLAKMDQIALAREYCI